MVTSLAAIRALALSPALFCIDGSSLDRIFLRVFLNSVQAGRPAPIRAFRVVWEEVYVVLWNIVLQLI